MNTPASVRLTLHLGPVHATRLQRLADEAGVKRSDLVRRWIDEATWGMERDRRIQAMLVGAAQVPGRMAMDMMEE